MPRTHDDDWDLASSVGATATFVASARAMATRDPRGLINDPFAEPLVRAVGLEFFTKMMDGELDIDAHRERHCRARSGDHRRNGGAHQVFRRLLPPKPGAHRRRGAPSRDTRVGFGRAGLPTALAGRHGGLRTRSAASDRVQDPYARGPRRG